MYLVGDTPTIDVANLLNAINNAWLIFNSNSPCKYNKYIKYIIANIIIKKQSILKYIATPYIPVRAVNSSADPKLVRFYDFNNN